MKKFLKVFLTVLVLILIVGAGGLYFWNNHQSLEGKWRTVSLEKQVEKEIEQQLGSQAADMGISAADLVKGANMHMNVKNDEAKITVTAQIDEVKFHQAIKTFIDKALEKQLKDQGLTYNDLSEAGKKIFDETKITDQQIDRSFQSAAQAAGGKYNTNTGEMTLPVMDGKVHRLTSVIKVSHINKKANAFYGNIVKNGEKTAYKKEGSKLILGNEKSYPFMKVTK
ncbi:TPA: hypothetical protein ACIOYG_001529 [Streptococcus agalactiae]|uniref:hypothetical protein n=1 Tax=Streptococcus agalactiae TaxID=1311 RepID=UPI0003031265|nr:hypothetical protein [Streptococcus agalactiae]MCH9566583.1 hypothetical protein [Streptococcus agalactiae]MCW1405167.1 hypothetical protein [Streptococcus agalactiae]MCW1791885.1 hypothetical protein [Streptococcus agalactiae]HEN2734593.1 hypothetical protein [Streptococcus agalactiae]HEO1038961.1 hypothetical protein [Streptococcus agalactiae]